MNTKQTLKILLSSALFMFAVMTAQAQVTFENDDYVSIGDATANVDSVTTGTRSGYYIMPDSYYHPNYTNAGGWALTNNFTWTWTTSDVANAILDDASTADNYVEVDFGAVGTYKISGREIAPALYGGCQSVDTSITVEVIPSPTVTILTGGAGIITGDLEVCEGAPELAGVVEAAFTGVQVGQQLGWDFTIWTLAGDHTTPLFYYDDDASTSLGAAEAAAIDSTFASNAQHEGINGSTFSLPKATGGFPVINNQSTVYRYTIDGVNDYISRKSDYLGNTAAAKNAWTVYDNTVETITIIVNPTPVTGPIYHIPNNWAN